MASREKRNDNEQLILESEHEKEPGYEKGTSRAITKRLAGGESLERWGYYSKINLPYA